MEPKLSNLYISLSPDIIDYKPKSGRGSGEKYPIRLSRRSHAEFLDEKFKQAWKAAEEKKQQKGAV